MQSNVLFPDEGDSANNNEVNDQMLQSDDEDDMKIQGDDEHDMGRNEEEDRDDDPVAEGDEPIAPKPEPSYAKASATKFFSICKGLEVVCRHYRKRQYMSDVDKLKTILKPEYLNWLSKPEPLSEDSHSIDRPSSPPPESIFPLLRLLLPDKDGSRSFLMKEKMIGKMYIDAFSFAANTSKYNKIMQYTNPNVVAPQEGVGDLSLVIHHIMNTMKRQSTVNNGLTIGELNKYLDELVSLPRKARDMKSNHDWRMKNNNNNTIAGNNSNTINSTTNIPNTGSSSANRKPPTLNSLRAAWLRRINTDTTERRGLSPLEHKWLVRILLHRLHIGVGWKTIVSLWRIRMEFRLKSNPLEALF
jgi:DNA ligase N terminus